MIGEKDIGKLVLEVHSRGGKFPEGPCHCRPQICILGLQLLPAFA
jgi:hypothetical protein